MLAICLLVVKRAISRSGRACWLEDGVVVALLDAADAAA